MIAFADFVAQEAINQILSLVFVWEIAFFQLKVPVFI